MIMDLERQYRTPLFDALVALAESKKVSFHTPGHKSGKGISTRFRKFVGHKIFSIDLTTLDEVDCLQKPIGVIKEAQELAADAYGARHSFFLVNGTTGGNHAMVLAVCRPQDKILVARNAHKSVVTGVILSGAQPVFFMPQIDETRGIALNVTLPRTQAILEAHPDAKAIFLTSPNYYGVCADLKNIIALSKQKGLIVLIDEAHGPHLRFHPQLPQPALEAGADACVQSTHKIIGGMTQSSMLHLKSEKIPVSTLTGVLHLIQSTSPSYVLMASLDLARMQMATEGLKLLTKTIDLAQEARARINAIPGLHCFGEADLAALNGGFSLDVTKLTISVRELGITGFQASQILNQEFDVQVEMADLYNMLVIVSIGDRRDDVERLVSALQQLPAKAEKGGRTQLLEAFPPIETKAKMLSREAYFAPYKYVELKKAVGKTSADIVTIYPPGIPILVPGELIGEEAARYILTMAQAGARIDGLEDAENPAVRVVK
jgi:arginine/lysine/ornithine decarboxylase